MTIWVKMSFFHFIGSPGTKVQGSSWLEQHLYSNKAKTLRLSAQTFFIHIFIYLLRCFLHDYFDPSSQVFSKSFWNKKRKKNYRLLPQFTTSSVGFSSRLDNWLYGDDTVVQMEAPALLSVTVQYPSWPPSAASLSVKIGTFSISAK